MLLHGSGYTFMLVLSKFTLFIHFVYTNGIKAELVIHSVHFYIIQICYKVNKVKVPTILSHSAMRHIKHTRWLALKIITYWSRVYRVWLQRQYLLSISASHRPEWQKWAPATLINILLRHEYFGLFVPRSCSISAAVAAAWRENVQSKD